MRRIIQQGAGAVTAVTERQPQANGPHQNANIVSLHQRGDWVGDHAHQQPMEHFGDAGRRNDFRGACRQCKCLRNQMAEDHRDHRREKGAQQIEHDNWPDITFLALLVVGNRGDHQHQYQQWRDRFQRTDKQFTQQTDCQRGIV